MAKFGTQKKIYSFMSLRFSAKFHLGQFLGWASRSKKQIRPCFEVQHSSGL